MADEIVKKFTDRWMSFKRSEIKSKIDELEEKLAKTELDQECWNYAHMEGELYTLKRILKGEI